MWIVFEVYHTSMSDLVVFKWLPLSLTSKQSVINNYTTGSWVWLWIQLFYMICEGENGTNECHLVIFSVNIAFARHFVAIHPPLTLPPYRSVVVLAMPVKIW